jgi:hypothetical protein
VELRGAFQRFRECAIEAARHRRQCERIEVLCGSSIWGEAHPLDVERIRCHERWRRRAARLMRDLLALLRSDLIGHKQALMHRIREAALAREPLDLSAGLGNVRFILLGTPQARARWCDMV